MQKYKRKKSKKYIGLRELTTHDMVDDQVYQPMMERWIDD